MSTINSLLQDSASEWKAKQSDASKIASKWGKTGLLEGLGSEIDKNNMALILENQAKQLVVEASATNIGGGTFTAGQGEQWAGVALPMVRKVFGNLSTKEFMSVQPMNLPSGLVFFLDFQYGQNKKLNFGGGSGDAYDAQDSLYGNTNPGAANNPSGGLYGAGRFGYSINQFQTSSAATSASAAWAQVNYDAELSASLSDLIAVTVDLPENADLNGVRAFSISGSGNENLILPEYTHVASAPTPNTPGTVVFILASGSAAVSSPVELFYNVQPVDNDRGDFEDQVNGGFPNAQSADDIAIPQIDIKMKSEPIVAKTRKLKSQWTPEFAQDLNAYQSLDAEAELTSIMSEYISLEIDLENLDMLIQQASAADEYWSTKSNTYLNQAKTEWDNDLGYFNTQGQWFQTLGTKFQKVSNKIHQKTLRGGANFMVVSPSVATVLESIPGFASTSDGEATKMNYAFGIQKSGNLNNRYQVYKNPYMTENVILMGYRGSQFLETGAVFAPYVPLIMTPLVYDPDTFTPRKGLLTRYAKKMIRPEFYGRVFVNDLASL